MSDQRIEIVTPCKEHERTDRHRLILKVSACMDIYCYDDSDHQDHRWCNGVTRRVLSAGEGLVILKDENGEWPMIIRGFLTTWAHAWPATSAHTLLDTLADLNALAASQTEEG